MKLYKDLQDVRDRVALASNKARVIALEHKDIEVVKILREIQMLLKSVL